jgi:hypothetical protein
MANLQRKPFLIHTSVYSIFGDLCPRFCGSSFVSFCIPGFLAPINHCANSGIYYDADWFPGYYDASQAVKILLWTGVDGSCPMGSNFYAAINRLLQR